MEENRSPLELFKRLTADIALRPEYKENFDRYFEVTYEFGRYHTSTVDDFVTISLYTKPNHCFYYSQNIDITATGFETRDFMYSSFALQNNYALIAYGFIKLMEENPNVERELKYAFDMKAKAYFKAEKDRFFKYIDEQFSLEEEASIQSDAEKIHIDVSLSISNSNYFIAEYKIGRTKKYNITSPSSFFARFKDKSRHKYGKELDILHIPETFDEPSRGLIEMFTNRKDVDSRGKSHYLNRAEVTKIIELYKGYEIEIFYHDDINEISGVYISNLDYLNPKVYIKKNYDLVVPEMENKYLLLKTYVLDSVSHKIDLISKSPSYSALVVAINDYRLPNIEDNLDDFKYTYFLKFQENFIIDKQIQDDFIFFDLRIDAYFDLDDNKLSVTTRLFSNDVEIFEEDLNKYNRSQYKKYLSILSKFGFVDFVATKQEDIWRFLTNNLDSLKSVANVYLSDSILTKSVSVFTPPQIKISYDNNLLDVFLEDSRYSEEELMAILDGLKKKKKYILYKDQIIGLDNENASKFLENTKNYELLDKKDKKKHARVPLYYAFKSLDDSTGVNINEKVYNVFDNIRNFKNSKFKIAKIEGTLRDYQAEGVRWLDILYKNNLSGVLADDMGLGKTIEVIAFLKSETVNNSLIVAPKTLLFNWKNEFRKFAPTMDVTIVYGTAAIRQKIIGEIPSKNNVIYITSYDSLRRDIDLYKDINFDTVILDEAQYIKNSKAQKTESVNKIKASHKFALTGTPIENSILDLWSIFNFLMPNYLPELSEFKEKYETSDTYVDSVRKFVAPFILRRNKKDVLKDLPEKYETILSCELLPAQRKVYDSQILVAKNIIDNGGTAFDVLHLLMRLRQACIDPRLFVENYSGGSGKLLMLKSIIEDRINEGHRILIFSQFVMALNLVKDILNELDLNYFVITGETAGEERVKIAEEFNATKKYQVGLVSLKAGGTGLNLVGADVVIHLDPWWNVATENQATDRAHRIGQERNVEVIKLIAEQSIEERVVELQNIKKDLVNKVISDDDSSITSLTIEDINFILKS